MILHDDARMSFIKSYIVDGGANQDLFIVLSTNNSTEENRRADKLSVTETTEKIIGVDPGEIFYILPMNSESGQVASPHPQATPITLQGNNFWKLPVMTDPAPIVPFNALLVEVEVNTEGQNTVDFNTISLIHGSNSGSLVVDEIISQHRYKNARELVGGYESITLRMLVVL